MPIIDQVGTATKDAILGLADLLREQAAPGIVTLVLLAALAVSIVLFVQQVFARRAALVWLRNLIARHGDAAELTANIERVDRLVGEGGISGSRKNVGYAWVEYRETLVPHDEGGQLILRNSVRPGIFFNSDDLHFSAGFWRIVPGLFVTVGLFLTFLGLISALHAMDLSDGKIEDSLTNLLTIASAKFIMSLTGLFCSIVFAIVLRWGMGRIDGAVHGLCAAIERRLTFISLENLAVEQLAATREQRENLRLLAMELVAELGRPLKEEVPKAISSSISEAMAPLLQQVGRAGTDGMEVMINDLSSRFSGDVGRALENASQRLEQAGGSIARLASGMDDSSRRMGTEIDGAVERLIRAVDDLRSSLGITAESASGAFTKGAEHLLAVMNQTLEGIRDNTGEGARAINAAALEMSRAAETFSSEIEKAADAGTRAAQSRIEQAGRVAGEAIDAAGRGVAVPLAEVNGRLEAMARALESSSDSFGRLSSSISGGADAAERAAGGMSSASAQLVEALVPIRTANEGIQSAIRGLADSTDRAASTVSGAALATATSAANAIDAARAILKAEQQAIEVSLRQVSEMLERLRGQGQRLDGLDRKLGEAFDLYTENVETAVEGMRDHVRALQAELAPALDTLRSVVDQAEQFVPQQPGRR